MTPPEEPADWYPPDLGPPEGLGNLPAFKDLSGLLGPSDSPVNWEVARQVAIWIATKGQNEPDPEPAPRETLAELVRLAQLKVEEFTGMPTGSEVVRLAVVNRRGWIDGNIPGFKYLLEKLADRLTAVTLQDPDGGEGEASVSIDLLIKPLMPVLLGAQIGVLLGYMAGRILGQYEVLLPSTEGGRLYLVLPNLEQMAHSYELDEREFFLWVSMHEVTHQAEFHVPWMRRHFTRLIEKAISQIEMSPESIVERLGDLNPSDPEGFEKIVADPASLIGAMFSPAAEKSLAELQAAMSVLEGYAEYVMDRASSQLIPSVDRMREVMQRRRAEKSRAERLLEQLLGLEMKRKQYADGETFCSAVAAEGGIDLLNRLWERPENLPTADEVQMPQMWQLRMESGL